jgi:hypothetical protein
MGQPEPPSSRSSLFFIGKDSRGHWVVQDQRHLYGGLFADRAEALRYALFENGNRPQAVVMVPGVFELDMSGQMDVTQPDVAQADVMRRPWVRPEAPRKRPVAAQLSFKLA